MLVLCLSRSTNSQVGVPCSNCGGSARYPTRLGLRRLSRSSTRPLTPGSGGPPRWHLMQSRVWRRASRTIVSRLLPPSRSTVNAIAGAPARSARYTICFVSDQSD